MNKVLLLRFEIKILFFNKLTLAENLNPASTQPFYRAKWLEKLGEVKDSAFKTFWELFLNQLKKTSGCILDLIFVAIAG